MNAMKSPPNFAALVAAAGLATAATSSLAQQQPLDATHPPLSSTRSDVSNDFALKSNPSVTRHRDRPVARNER
ncbi:MAG TPA: hypothetical protein VFS42_00350 [Burkholderiaceae bacterium]|nr:hypothetical protein [Burkholderiaceae bacterium]